MALQRAVCIHVTWAEGGVTGGKEQSKGEGKQPVTLQLYSGSGYCWSESLFPHKPQLLPPVPSLPIPWGKLI